MPPYRGASNPVSVPNLWLVIFSSTLAAILVATLIIFLCLRAYIAYSIADTFKDMKDPEHKRTR